MDYLISSDAIKTYNTYREIEEEKEVDPYLGSTFEKIKNHSPRKKGSEFEKIVKEFFIKNGYEIRKSRKSDHDFILINKNNKEIKIEVKGSTLWGCSDSMKWQQIRRDQDYDIIIFLCMFPEYIELYFCSKEEAKRNIFDVVDNNGKLCHNQHGGKNADSGTFAIQGAPTEFSFFRKITEFEDWITTL